MSSGGVIAINASTQPSVSSETMTISNANDYQFRRRPLQHWQLTRNPLKILLLAALLTPWLADAQPYSIDWHKVAAGGSDSGAGGATTLARPSASTTRPIRCPAAATR